MFNIHVYYTADSKEAIHAFYEDVKAAGIIESSRKDEGNLVYEYYFSAERENEILLVEKWETKELQEAHDVLPPQEELAKIKKKYDIKTAIDVI